MVDVFNKVSFLELGQGNIMILRKNKFVYLELIWKRSNKPKPPSFSLLAWTFLTFINVLDVSQKSQAFLVSQAVTYTHTVQKLGWAWWLDPIATWKKKEGVYHIPFMKPAHAWNMSQAPGTRLHMLDVSGARSLLLTPSLSTAAPEVRLGSIFPSASLLQQLFLWF